MLELDKMFGVIQEVHELEGVGIGLLDTLIRRGVHQDTARPDASLELRVEGPRHDLNGTYAPGERVCGHHPETGLHDDIIFLHTRGRESFPVPHRRHVQSKRFNGDFQSGKISIITHFKTMGGFHFDTTIPQFVNLLPHEFVKTFPLILNITHTSIPHTVSRSRQHGSFLAYPFAQLAVFYYTEVVFSPTSTTPINPFVLGNTSFISFSV
mmetsp:Transcript_28664/g.65503  ORF Transcript_28664/g.65503 Transcript_28664/m.65503 type:complete len:210 (-) Transcript_28664:731-1360(-)